MSDSIFGEVISTYTRRQAIEDGVLVQLSGPGYEGDQWIPDMVAEAGIKFPVAMTVETFVDCVSPLEDGGAKLAPCQDIKGRLWDVLWMLRCAIGRAGSTDIINYELRVVPNVPADYDKDHPPRAKLVRLKAVCGPDDDGAPCITIMYPHQD